MIDQILLTLGAQLENEYLLHGWTWNQFEVITWFITYFVNTMSTVNAEVSLIVYFLCFRFNACFVRLASRYQVWSCNFQHKIFSGSFPLNLPTALTPPPPPHTHTHTIMDKWDNKKRNSLTHAQINSGQSEKSSLPGEGSWSSRYYWWWRWVGERGGQSEKVYLFQR